jgi:8-oxo-dGTP pyrophosphatase MutT (NUDIX family)
MSAAPPTRFSCGVVSRQRLDRKLKFLLLRAYRNWDFPKGLVEPGEEPIDAAVREVREETALDDISFDWGMVFMDTGPYNKGKISRYYIARSKEVRISLPINPDLACRSIRRRAGSTSTRRSPWYRRGFSPSCGGPSPRSITSEPTRVALIDADVPSADLDDIAADEDAALGAHLQMQR